MINNIEIIKALKAENKKLKTENAELEKRKKYGLVWANKPEIFDEQSRCAYPILRGKDDKNYPDISHQTDSDNNQKPHILIEGDNYHTLSVLNATHQKKIDVIYIDPPYNTGNKDFKYNDSFVDKEDKFRHSKWLSFMAKRLRLAKKLLADDGVIFISIDDNEQANLKVLCDDIFGQNNFVANLNIYSNPRGRQSSKHFAETHEYILAYAKDIFKLRVKGEKLTPKQKKEYNKKDEIGIYREIGLRKRGADSKKEDSPNLFFSIYYSAIENKISLEKLKNYVEIIPKLSDGSLGRWRWSKNKILLDINQLMVRKVKRKELYEYDIFQKDYLSVEKTRKIKTSWIEKEINYDKSSSEQRNILGKKIFEYAKPIYLLKKIVKFSLEKNDIILDFFAGTGTTAHAVLELNKQDGGNRQCILATNNENDICEDITYERVKRVIEGYTTLKGKAVAGLGGQLHYLKTGFVPKDNMKSISDGDKIAFSHQVGIMLALKENTFNEVKSNHHYQIFSSDEKITGIYFSENLHLLNELLDYFNAQNLPCYLYAYPQLDEEYFKSGNIKLSEIPEHILQIYQTIGAI